ncbi:pilus assembly PilX family protein [Thauera aromatica]|uniref:pilus assembly PilX family protein n=1 Tax=Thauera aromatica TaxID=59405 RepID=UPI001FFC3FC7|nr:hypothetical protein [Thauera aromatica]
MEATTMPVSSLVHRPPAAPHAQEGAMALLFSVVVLLISTLTVFVASRSTLSEQRLSANEARSRAAFEHAQGGMDYAVGEFARGLDITTTTNPLNTAVDPDDDSKPALPDELAAQIRVAFCSPAVADFRCADTPAATPPIQNCQPPAGAYLLQPFAVACGWSDDNAARHIVIQRLSGTPAFPSGTINNPLSTPSSAGLGGSFTVVNYFNNLTYWTGGSLDYGNATVKSFIRNPGSTPANYSDDSVYPTESDIYKSYQLADALGDQCAVIADENDRVYNNKCKAPTNKSTTHLLQSTDKGANANTIGADVVDKDINLAALSEASFFRQFFGLDKTDYKGSITSQILTPSEAADKFANGVYGEVIWVDGNLTLSGTEPIGTIDRPVVLIVDGDLALGAGIDFYGVLYTSGSLSGNANGNIYGAVLAHGGTTNLNGNPTIFYDEGVLVNTAKVGRRTTLPGSWRDWSIE